MDNPNCNTEHRKFQHLTAEERHEIEVRFNKDKWTIYQIAKQLCRPFNTIKYEINRGLVLLYHGTVQRYSAKKAEQVYLEHRSHCRKQYKRLATSSFIQYVEDHFKDGWSLDACVGRAEIEGLFPRDQMVCTKTLYNYVDAGLLGIKNIDLPNKLSRKTKPARIRQNKRVLGDSISERPEEAETRQEFGHWEIDTVRGVKKETEPAVLTLVERKSRYSIWLKIMSANEYVSCKCVSLLFALADWMNMKDSEEQRKERFERESNPPSIIDSFKKMWKINSFNKEQKEWTSKTIVIGKDISLSPSIDECIDCPYIVPLIKAFDAWGKKNYGTLSKHLEKLFDYETSEKKRASECRKLFASKEFRSFKLKEIEERACSLTRILVQVEWTVESKNISEPLEFGIVYQSDDKNDVAVPWRNNGEWKIFPWKVHGLYKRQKTLTE